MSNYCESKATDTGECKQVSYGTIVRDGVEQHLCYYHLKLAKELLFPPPATIKATTYRHRHRAHSDTITF